MSEDQTIRYEVLPTREVTPAERLARTLDTLWFAGVWLLALATGVLFWIAVIAGIVRAVRWLIA